MVVEESLEIRVRKGRKRGEECGSLREGEVAGERTQGERSAGCCSLGQPRGGVSAVDSRGRESVKETRGDGDRCELEEGRCRSKHDLEVEGEGLARSARGDAVTVVAAVADGSRANASGDESESCENVANGVPGGEGSPTLLPVSRPSCVRRCLLGTLTGGSTGSAGAAGRGRVEAGNSRLGNRNPVPVPTGRAGGSSRVLGRAGGTRRPASLG